jgi:GT2 family glycosyltransferase
MVTPLVYILVLNYCSLRDTLACVETIREINYPNFRLLVIDNDSPDGSGEELASKIDAPELLRLPENIGYAGGNNAGFKIALNNCAEYVFVVNPDVRLPSDSLSRYIELLESDFTIGAMNPIQLNSESSIDDSFARAVLATSQPYHQNLQGIRESTTLFGAALMLPSRTLRTVGGFDPLFFAYGEEEDLCRRIRDRGLKLVVTPEAPVTHHRTKEKATVSDFVLFLRLKGTYLYNLKAPQLGFRYALKHFFLDFFEDVFGKRKTAYPFSRYPIKLTHVLRAGYWVVSNIRTIRDHRKLDKTLAPFIGGTPE